MIDSLRNHPFAVEAFFPYSLVLTFALPCEDVMTLLPPCLRADTLDERYAFLAVAMVQTRHLRPKGLPVWAGQDFFLIGYRIFVRYTDVRGRNLRGLYILGSQTNRRKMEWLGSLMTRYRYTTIDIQADERADQLHIRSAKAGLDIVADLRVQPEEARLPEGSPFADWKAARRFAGPLPFTFSWLPESQQVLIVEGVREQWQPRPVAIVQQEVGFLREPTFRRATLANAFLIQNIPYHWKKGRLEPCPPHPEAPFRG